MHISYVGNFQPNFSTETHVAKAAENLGHTVQRIPEQSLEWLELPDLVEGELLMWTRTAGFDPPDSQRQANALKAVTVPKVGFHLDRWFGLAREATERGPRAPDASPFFTHMDLLMTADGGHQDRWAVRHVWSPPGILSDECELGTPQPRFTADVGFVGNLIGYGHKEWGPYRQALYDFLRKTYHGRFQLFPGPGRGQIRGRDLADLYATVKVLVGDSCLAGGITHYWSDRIPETTGRGGFLIHPRVEGLAEHYPDLVTYGLGNFDELEALIEDALAEPDWRAGNAAINRTRTLEHHTYEHRITALLDLI
jgi:hypothetical protein